MTRLAAAVLLTVTTGVTVVLSHKRPAPVSSATLAPVIPFPDRASRSDVRRPLPGVGKPRRRAPVRRPGPHSTPGSGALNWDALAQCESSGDWHINTGNGYYGGLQEDETFWRNYGGLRFASRPDLASRAAQITVALRGLRVQGRGAWPQCGWRLAS